MCPKLFDRLLFSETVGVCVLGLLLSGCSGSNESRDPKPSDIRGEPINQPESIPSPVIAVSNSSGSGPVASPANAVDGKKASDIVPVGFDKLASFEFVMSDETAVTNGITGGTANAIEQFPPTVKALDNSRVALKGFMLPLKVESGLVTELLLLRDQSMCCYGKVPKITEWVSVKMSDKGVKAVVDQPITICGKLHVGEMRENGYLIGIYRMEGERMNAPE